MSKEVDYNLLTYAEFGLSYKTFGCGENTLLAFSGFGQEAEVWKVFENTLGKKYTLYAFNHFFHGPGNYPAHRIDKDTLKKEELFALLEQFFREKNITRFSVAGYSMGGRISLTLMEHFKDQIDTAWLFAPDGLKPNFWYSFASKTKLGQGLYKTIIHRPSFFFAVIKILKKIGVLNKKTGDFVLRQMATYEKRLLVYNTWMAYRLIMPDLKRASKNIEHGIQTHLFLGKYDFIFPPKMRKRLQVKKNLTTHIVETGHNLLANALVPLITKIVNE